MTNNGVKYQRVGDEEDDAVVRIELKDMREPIDKAVQPTATKPSDDFWLKILHKESSHILKSIALDSTVAQLKVAVETLTTTPVSQQRLLFAGKLLKPDDKPLSHFNVYNTASIHLFPIPVATPTTTTPSGGTLNPLVEATAVPEMHPRQQGAVFNDPFVEQTARAVKLWCMVLMVLSGMTLFNNLSFITSTGTG